MAILRYLAVLCFALTLNECHAQSRGIASTSSVSSDWWDFVFVSSEAELREALFKRPENCTIFVNATRLQLRETIVIESMRLNLRGYGGSRPEIHCPPGQRNALILRGYGIKLTDLHLTNCAAESAIVIEGSHTTSRRRRRSIILRRLQFSRNGRKENFMNGSGIRMRGCLTQPCFRPGVKILSSQFIDNSAYQGGAIYAEDYRVRIRNSTFLRNTAIISGGAIFMKNPNTSLVVKSSEFDRNEVSWEVKGSNLSLLYRDSGLVPEEKDSVGGAICALDAERVIIRKSTFRFNKAHGGGALGVHNHQRQNNKEVVFEVSDTEFSNNNVSYHKQQTIANIQDISLGAGGAISHVVDNDLWLRWNIQRSKFVDNSGISGGGLHISGAPEVQRNVTECIFKRNSVGRAGGGIFVFHAHLAMSSTNISEGRAGGGGGIMLWESSSLTVEEDPAHPSMPSVIEGNAALYGGGILIYQLGRVATLSALIIRGNKAFLNGGGIRVDDAKGPMELRGVIVEENLAIIGGGIECYAAANLTLTSHRGQPTIVRNNMAANGGGLYFEPGHYPLIEIFIHDSQFVGNRAADYEKDDIKDFIEEGKKFVPSSLRLFEDSDDFDDPDDMSIVRQLTDSQNGHGGDIVFQNVSIQENTADVGGGVYVQFSKAKWNNRPFLKCRHALIGLESCRRFIFSEVKIAKNKAKFAGGLFTVHPDKILVTCDPNGRAKNATFRKVFMRQLTQKIGHHRKNDSHCLDISQNELQDQGKRQGADAGTRAKSLHIEEQQGPLEDFASGETFGFLCPAASKLSEAKRCPLRVAVKDSFNQTISAGIPDAELSVSLESHLVVGRLRYTATEGIITINETRVKGINENATLIVKNEDDKHIRGVIDFSVRGCLPGEFKGTDECHKCEKGTYSFNASVRCRQCEENAVCNGSASLVPADGYWHSTPFSPIMNRCVRSAACQYDGRASHLTTYSANVTDVEAKWEQVNVRGDHDQQAVLETAFAGYAQCAKGYTGPLCGSCMRNFGHSFTGECDACPSKTMNTKILTFVTVFWTFVMIGVNCLVTLVSTRMRIELARLEAQRIAAQRPRVIDHCGHVTEEAVWAVQLKRTNTTSETTGVTEMSEEEYNAILIQNLNAAVQLTETLKILINYLQVTSSALRLPVHWRSALKGLLSFQAVCVGVASEALSAPFECNFDDEHDWPPSVIAIWMHLLTPIVVMIALLSVYTIFWLVRHWNATKSERNQPNAITAKHLVTSVVVIALVTASFSFIDSIRELLRTINCIEVDRVDRVDRVAEDEPSDHPYREFAVQRGAKVWAEDTELRCFKGKHLPTGTAGIAGLALASLFVLFIILWMPFHQASKTRPLFVSRYGFLYQAYREEWYRNPWEAMILIRKACISAVVVFSVHLDSDLQATMCVGILIVFHGFQMMAQPFKRPEGHCYVPEYAGSLFNCFHLPKLAPKWIELNNKISLNALESGSLLCSIVVFYSALVLNNPNASELGKLSMIVFAFSVSVGFISYMLYRLYCGLHVLVDLKLEMMDPNFVAVKENGIGVVHFVAKLVHLMKAQLNVLMIHKSEHGRTTSAETVETEPTVTDAV